MTYSVTPPAGYFLRTCRWRKQYKGDTSLSSEVKDPNQFEILSLDSLMKHKRILRVERNPSRGNVGLTMCKKNVETVLWPYYYLCPSNIMCYLTSFNRVSSLSEFLTPLLFPFSVTLLFNTRYRYGWNCKNFYNVSKGTNTNLKWTPVIPVST